VLFEYLWCVSIIYSKTMLQKFCKRHRCMSSKLKKKSWEKNRRKCLRSLDPSYLVHTYEF
jgi:hypothetical protein